MQRSGARRLTFAVAAALLLHALLFAALALLPRPRARRALQVALVRRPAAPALPGPLAIASPPATAAAPSRSPAKSAAPALAAAPGAAHSSPAAAPAASAAPAVRSPGWLAAEGVSRPGSALSLSLEHPEAALPALAPPASDGLVRAKSPAEQRAEEKATVERKLTGWVSDVKARDRAEHGRDRYWQGLEDALAHGFDPGWDVLDQGPREKARSGAGAFIESWQRQAEAYGKSGSPYGGGAGAPGAAKPLHQELTSLGNDDRGLSGVSLGNNLFPLPSAGVEATVAAAGEGPFHHTLTATVRITQREDGSLFGVELLGTSGNAAFDRIVLGQARTLARLQLGPPRQGRETLWAFETEFVQIPPVPIVGCALDDFVPKHCFYPLQKRTRSRVHLQAIY